MKVYVLQHEYEIAGGQEETKLIGVYSTKENAQAAISRLVALPGFVEHPDDFCIDEYETDQDHWTEGFVAMLRNERVK